MSSRTLNSLIRTAPCALTLLSFAAVASADLKTRFTYVITAPDSAKTVRIWTPVPSDNRFQKVTNVNVTTAGTNRLTREPKFGNRISYVELAPGQSRTITLSCDVTRSTAKTFDDSEPRAQFLEPDRLVPTTGRFAEIAEDVTDTSATDAQKLEQIFEHTVASMQYDYKKESPKLGQGDVAFVCDYKKGNCSDLHSYIISLARAEGIPAYLEYGFPLVGIPFDSAPTTGKISGYHCWTWAYIDGKGWTPLDASDARRWLDSGKPEVKEKLFGELVLERSAVAFSRGRDIKLVPPQAGMPINSFIYPYAEAGDSPVEAKWELSYERLDVAKPAATPAQSDKPTVTPYGFVRLDTIFDTQRPNPNNQFPFWINSPDQTGGGDRERFTLHPRLSRFGVNVSDPREFGGGWKANAQIEFDFQNGGSESRPTPRARILWASATRGDTTIGFGQTWDVIAPLIPAPNDDSLMWNAGNLGDRRPQIQWRQASGNTTFAIAAGQTGAVDAKDLDGDGVRDGEDSGMPGFQARLGFMGTNFSGGIWGHIAKERTATAVGGETEFTSQSLGVDASFKLGQKASLRGEFWSGENLSDMRGGVGQGVNTTTGREIESAGGWLEVGFAASPVHNIALGYTVDDPKNSHIAANGRTKNSAYYLHNKWTLGAGVEVGLNILRWDTEFNGLAKGKDTRFNLFFTRRF